MIGPERRGYIVADDDGMCLGVHRAVCTAEDWMLGFEASGDDVTLLLPQVVWQARSGWVQDLIGVSLPFEVPFREPETDRLDRLGFVDVPDIEPLEDCRLWVPHQELRVERVQVTFLGADWKRSLVTASLRLLAVSDAGDVVRTFDAWLCCDYAGELCDPEELL